MNEEEVEQCDTIVDKLKIQANKKFDSFNKKIISSFTPSPGSKKPFFNKFPIEDVAEFDDIVYNSKFEKLSLTTKAQKIKFVDGDTLSGKMPNFVRFCDDLIDLIKEDSKDKLKIEKPARKQSEASIYY
jgi:hypothetical protein